MNVPTETKHLLENSFLDNIITIVLSLKLSSQCKNIQNLLSPFNITFAFIILLYCS